MIKIQQFEPCQFFPRGNAGVGKLGAVLKAAKAAFYGRQVLQRLQKVNVLIVKPTIFIEPDKDDGLFR